MMMILINKLINSKQMSLINADALAENQTSITINSLEGEFSMQPRLPSVPAGRNH